MVTKSEQKVIGKYKKEKYFHVHAGSPDFLFYRLKTIQANATQDQSSQLKTTQVKAKQNPPLSNIDIDSIEFVEVKYNGDTLSHEQQIWKHILEGLGLKYKLIHIQKEQDR